LTPLISTAVFHVLLGLVTGLFLYVVIRDSLPAEESGAPAYFLAGMLIYTAIVVRIWLLG
ncbi:MAG: hypothetical protein SVW77_03240, partial [Candidatus Nanohaloarchaea archaeon]|nr:hypothetical protein [Candidatus Nanohaloarchaea archaeon]